MATVRLDQRRVDRLGARKSAYDVRDRELKGFGVGILLSGAKRYWGGPEKSDSSFHGVFHRLTDAVRPTFAAPSLGEASEQVFESG